MEFSYSLILIVGITFLVSIIYIILVTPIIRKYADKVKESGISTSSVESITTTDRKPERVYMPNHPVADESGFVYQAAVNIEEEFIEMTETNRQYQNNVEVVTTLRALMMRTINMGK